MYSIKVKNRKTKKSKWLMIYDEYENDLTLTKDVFGKQEYFSIQSLLDDLKLILENGWGEKYTFTIIEVDF